MDKEKVIEWLKDGSIIYYFYLSGGIAISNPKLTGYDSVQWLDFSTFDELRKDGTIDMTGEGNYTDIRAEKYQSYTMDNK